MTTTPNLGLPYIDAAQAQKQVTHNEALRNLDALVQTAIVTRTLSGPPAGPANGACNILSSAGTGVWAGQPASTVAGWQDGAWQFYAPKTGWFAWIVDESVSVHWTGTAWQTFALPASLAQLAINTTPDSANKLSVSSSAVLFNNVGNGVQVKLNKNGPADTASVLYQDGFSGRAEAGLTGDDSFHIKVSANGTAWQEALHIDATSALATVLGDPALPLGIATKQYVDAHAGSGGAVGPTGPQGPIGLPGTTGAQGPVGPTAWTAVAAWAATIAYVVGPPASVVSYNGGTYVCTTAHTSGASFDITKWQQMAAPGATGANGPQGPAGTVGATGANGAQGSIGPTGATGAAGPNGAAGPANTLAIGTVTSGAAAATITGTAPNQTLNLVLPTGAAGAQGPAGATGATGAAGAAGTTGAAGAAGQGVPAGGTAGQILYKNSSTNYDAYWVGSLANFGFLGIGTTASAANPLAVLGPATLLTADATGNHRLYINKTAAGNTASVLYQDGTSGRAEIGLAGDDNFHFKVSADGATWKDALGINATTGQVTANYGFAGGDAVGFRNRLRNPQFAINSRAVSGTVTLAAGAYGHDGVKAGAAGATYTFAASGIDTTLTISAGSLILPIEAGLIEGGTYALSQAGTAQARVWQGTGSTGTGTYAAAPFSSNGLTANTQTNVEFTTGTVLRPQFEQGAIATAFERRPGAVETMACQRFFWQIAPGTAYSPIALGGVPFAGYTFFFLQLPTAMYAKPTVVLSSISGAYSDFYVDTGAITGWTITAGQSSVLIEATTAAATSLVVARLMTNNNTNAKITFSCEI